MNFCDCCKNVFLKWTNSDKLQRFIVPGANIGKLKYRYVAAMFRNIMFICFTTGRKSFDFDIFEYIVCNNTLYIKI